MKVIVYSHKGEHSVGVFDALHKAGIRYKTADLIIKKTIGPQVSFDRIPELFKRPLIAVETKSAAFGFFGYSDVDEEVIPEIKKMMSQDDTVVGADDGNQ